MQLHVRINYFDIYLKQAREFPREIRDACNVSFHRKTWNFHVIFKAGSIGFDYLCVSVASKAKNWIKSQTVKRWKVRCNEYSNYLLWFSVLSISCTRRIVQSFRCYSTAFWLFFSFFISELTQWENERQKEWKREKERGKKRNREKERKRIFRAKVSFHGVEWCCTENENA